MRVSGAGGVVVALTIAHEILNTAAVVSVIVTDLLGKAI